MHRRHNSRPGRLSIVAAGLALCCLTACSGLTAPDEITIQKEPPPPPPAAPLAAENIPAPNLGAAQPGQPSPPRPQRPPGGG